MEEQRERARTGAATITPDRHAERDHVRLSEPETRFVGYETLSATTSVAAAERATGVPS